MYWGIILPPLLPLQSATLWYKKKRRCTHLWGRDTLTVLNIKHIDVWHCVFMLLLPLISFFILVVYSSCLFVVDCVCNVLLCSAHLSSVRARSTVVLLDNDLFILHNNSKRVAYYYIILLPHAHTEWDCNVNMWMKYINTHFYALVYSTIPFLEHIGDGKRHQKHSAEQENCWKWAKIRINKP